MSEERLREELNSLSRRSFLKKAGVLVGGAAVGTGALLSGCTDAPNDANAGVNTDEIKWDLETDVLVCGSGHCGGLPAAIEAAKAGAEVLVIERNTWIGGLSRIGGDGFTMGGNNWLQRQEGVVDDDEAWFQEEMYSNGYRGVPELIRALIANGNDTLDWLRDLGLEFSLTNGVFRPGVRRGFNLMASPNYPGKRELPEGGASDGGPGFTYLMVKELEKLGVEILLEHRMRSIYRQPGGPVIGVQADTPNGPINIKARKGIHLATGTWTDNYRMVQAWDPRAVGPDCFGDGGTPFDGKLYVDSAGDGHIAAAAIGAGFADMSFASYYYIFFGTRSYWAWDPADFSDISVEYYTSSPRTALFDNKGQVPYGILVKGDGKRFVNEMHAAQASEPGRGSMSENPEWPFPSAYLSLPHPRNVWVIADADGAAAMEWPIEDMRNPNPAAWPMLDPACVAIADSLDELATKMNIPAAELKKTVDGYNGFVDAGVDEDFGKPMPMFKIAAPPFYAAKASLIRHTQRNGLRVNTKSQVLEQIDQADGYSGTAIDSSISIDDEKVIPHLYAAGELGNSMGFRRVHNSVAHYITASRLAGINGAKETSWE
jgi:succinate dehydrogenase/fumarate reductase flavoprotein subunit